MKDNVDNNEKNVLEKETFFVISLDFMGFYQYNWQ